MMNIDAGVFVLRLKLGFLSAVILLLTLTTANAQDVLQIATFDIEGRNNRFIQLDDKENPFHLLNELAPIELHVAPPARAMRLFCNGHYDILYPIVNGAISCDAELVTVFNIETSIYHNRPVSEVQSLGLRLGFEYDIDRISEALNSGVTIHYVASDVLLVRMLVASRVDAILVEENSFELLFENLVSQHSTFQKTHFQSMPVQLGVNPSEVELVTKVKDIFLVD